MELPRNFAKYQLTALLADGRMGKVYKAKSHGVEGFEKILCVKIIRPELASESAFVDTLIEEAKRAGSLSHANVSQVHDLGRDEDTGRFYVASEFVNGFDLGAALELGEITGLGLPAPLAIFVASEVAKGMDFAHRRKDFNFNDLNLVHRDICPANILVSFDGEVKVSDFGISRALDTVPASLEPDPARRYRYAAPEHARGQEYTRQSDIFGLGLVLYEMLAGFHPYEQGDAPVRDRAARADIPPLDRVAELPRPLVRIVESMLVPDPAGRADSAGAIYEELIGYLYSNDLQGDNRALSLHMQELRQAEPADGSASSNMPAEPGLNEISQADVEDFIDQSSAAVSDEHDSIDPRADRNAPAEGSAPTLPGGLEEYFHSASRGEGKVVLMSGRFGRGSQYLPDRLGEVLRNRGGGRVLNVQAAPDDIYRPLGLFAELVLQCVAPDIDSSAPIDSMGFRRRALRRVRQVVVEGGDGVDSAAADTVGALWGLGPLPRMDQRKRREAVSRLFFELLDEYSYEEPVVAIVDRVERADPLSIDLLRDLVGEVAELPVLLVLSTSADEAMRETFDVGRPDSLKAARVSAEETGDVGDLDDLSKAGARILLALALAERPLTRTALAKVLGMARRRLSRRIEKLAEANLVRTPGENTYLIGVTEPGVWLRQRFDADEIAETARAMARHLQRNDVLEGPDLQTPTLVRLFAQAGASRRVLELADAYADWLEINGWLEIGLKFYGFAADQLAKRRVGSPQARIDYLLSKAELALELARAEEARDSLQPVGALTEATRDDHGFARSQLLAGRMAMQEDEPRQARAAFIRATEVAEGLNHPVLLSRCRMAMAEWWHRWGDNDDALQALRGAETLAEQAGFRRYPPDERAIAADLTVRVLVERDMVQLAEDYARQLHSLARATGLVRIECRAELARAELAAGGGERDVALDHLDRAQSIADRDAPSTLSMAVKRRRAAVALEEGRDQLTISLAKQLIETARRLDDAYTERRARDLRAAAVASSGRDRQGALETLEESLQRARERGVPRDIERGHLYLAHALAESAPRRAAEHRQQARG